MAEVLDSAFSTLERIEVQGPCSGFITIYDGNCEVYRGEVLPGYWDWPLCWTFSEDVIVQSNLPNDALAILTFSGTRHEAFLHPGRNILFTLNGSVDDEDRDQYQVSIRGATREQQEAEIEAALRQVRRANSTRRTRGSRPSIDISEMEEAGRRLFSAFEGMSISGLQASGALEEVAESFVRSIRMDDSFAPPEHPNCRSAIQEWRDASDVARQSLFSKRSGILLKAIDSFISSHRKTIEKEVETFVWTTKEREKLRISQMTTQHLFYAMRSTYNNTVGKFPEKQRSGLVWSIEDGVYSNLPLKSRRAVVLLMAHIEERKDLPLRCFDEYLKMVSIIVNVDLFKSLVCEGRKFTLSEEETTSYDAEKELLHLGVIPGSRRINVKQ